jgi:hypothetical protein
MEWFSRKTSIAGVEIPNWSRSRCRRYSLASLLIHALSDNSSKADADDAMLIEPVELATA